MNSILAMAEQLVLDKIISDKAPVTGESKIKVFLIAFSGFMALIGIGFISYATYLWLSVHYPPVAVMAAMGGIALFFSLLSALVVYNIVEYKNRKIKEMRLEIFKVAEDALNIFEKELSVPVNDNPKTSVLIASLAGYLAGDRFL